MTLTIWQDTTRTNTITENHQYTPDITGLANGNILVTWTDASDLAADGYGSDVMGQILDPLGTPLGDPIFLNEGYGENREESNPQAVATPDGGFILIYNYFGNSEQDQLFRRFDADGQPTGQQSYVVNDASGGTFYSDFDIALRPDGSAVIIYRRDDGSDEDLMYRALNTDGSIGAEVEVRYDQDPSGNTQGDPDNPASAVLNDGRVIVVYQEEDNTIYGAEYSIINTDGTVTQRYNVTPADTRQDDVDVAALADGGFVITWREGTTLKAQLYDNASPYPAKRGGEVDLATDTNAKDTARVTQLDDGGFAVTWIDRTDKVITTKVFDADGVETGDPLDLSYGGFDAYNLDVATSADGRIMVTWQAYPDDSYSDLDVMHAILDARTGLITVEDGTVTTASRIGSAIDGSMAEDVFYGMEGRDDLSGKGGADSLFGGAGDDEINGGKGGDMLRGDKGHDEVYGDTGADRIWTGNGNDKAWGGGGRDQVWGGDGADKVWGGSNHDKLYGGDGRDKLWGDKGEDRLYGGDGADTIWGNDGEDVIKGGAGADRIIGGADQDRMQGDGGADTFVFKSASDARRGAETRDVILDFEVNRDTIDLSAIDADTTRSGNQAFDFIGTEGFDDAGDLRIHLKNGDAFVRADRDGDGVADFEIKLETPGALDAFDFIL